MRHAPPLRIWQRNYYEHIIRDEASWNHIREYIQNNPLQWEIDREHLQAHPPHAEETWHI